MSQRERRRRRLEALVHAALTIAGRRMEELFAVPPEQRPPDGLRALAADTARPLVQMLADELPLTGDDVEVIVETLVFGMLTWMVLALQAQVTLLVTFLPAVMLSGFLFDLRSMPAAIRMITYILPARYYVALLQTVFLAGDVWSVIVPNATVLAGMAAVLLFLTLSVTKKKLA